MVLRALIQLRAASVCVSGAANGAPKRILWRNLSSSRVPGVFRCIADVCIVPSGVGPSVSKHVVEAIRVFENDPRLAVQPHAMGTNIEGEFDDVMKAIKEATLAVHISGVARITTTIKVGTRLDVPRHDIDYKTRRMQEELDAKRAADQDETLP